MQMNLKKLCPVFGLICVSLFTTANAQSYNQSDSSDMHQKGGQYREITPSAGPRVAGGADIFMDVDFIWWNACQEGKEYLTSSEVIRGAQGSNKILFNGTTNPGASAVARTNVVGIDGGISGEPRIQNYYLVPFSKKTETNITEKWSAGFKVGLGLNLGHDGWDMALRYTWLNPSVTTSLDRSAFARLNAAGEALVTKRTVPAREKLVLLGMPGMPSSKYDLDYNTLDLELARNSYFSQYLQCRLFSGLKGVWQNHTTAITAMADNDSTFRVVVPSTTPNQYTDLGDGATFDSYKVNEVMKIGGIGLRSGVNLLFLMSKNVGLYSDIALTGMWVRYRDLYRKDTIFNSTAKDKGKTVLHAKKGTGKDGYYDTVKGVTELGLGLLWQAWMLDDRYHIAFKAGFEEQIWHNWGTSFKADGSSMPWADFKTYGLKLNLRFDF